MNWNAVDGEAAYFFAVRQTGSCHGQHQHLVALISQRFRLSMNAGIMSEVIEDRHANPQSLTLR